MAHCAFLLCSKDGSVRVKKQALTSNRDNDDDDDANFSIEAVKHDIERLKGDVKAVAALNQNY
jgi:hypothetical protein